MARASLAAVALVLVAAPARGERAIDLAAAAVDAASHADDDRLDVAAQPAERPSAPRYVGTAALEAAIVFAIPTAWYWRTSEHQAVDWELDGSWESWKLKLFTTEKLKFDTNPFHVNAIRHPLAGVLDYQIARTNNFSWIESTAFAYVKGAAWEYLIEYREDPSINDMIFNGTGGLSIGEPLYQLGQLWRSERPSVTDRIHTAVFSPFDAVHDLYRSHHVARPSAWRSFLLAAGAEDRRFGDGGGRRSDATLVADLDLVVHPAFVEPGAHDGTTGVGAWTRLRAALRHGDELDGTFFHSRTSVTGRYIQRDDGLGVFAGAGAAFTYRREALAMEWDRLAIAHLFGPQFQLSKRTDRFALRWDAAAYADFALVQALVFGPDRPFPRPPPFLSSLQADGYYDAAGATAATRLRADAGPWSLDLEVDGHRFWQIDGHDRHEPPPDASGERSLDGAESASGIVDWRAFGRAALGFQPGRWGVALTADAAYRASAWQDLERRLVDVAVGGLVRLDY